MLGFAGADGEGPTDKDGGGWGGEEAAVRRPPPPHSGCYNTSSLRGGERLVLPSAQAHEWGCCRKALSPLSARRHGVEQGAPFMHSHRFSLIRRGRRARVARFMHTCVPVYSYRV